MEDDFHSDAEDAAPADDSAATAPRISPAIIDRVSDRHDISRLALMSAVSDDISLTRGHADEVVQQRPVVEEYDEYLIVHAGDASQTPPEVRDVYRELADLDARDYIASGHPLLVPRDALSEY